MRENIRKWEEGAEKRRKAEAEEIKKEMERYKASKIGDAHASLVDAKLSIRAALERAKERDDEIAVGLCNGLLYLCDAVHTVARDTEITRNRVNVIVNGLPPDRRRP